ncbi:uncharacterized protein BDW70DRAFT_152183 [Aspergillus foveolatus]|uniref:uncharacterized protein n=1 Tax=Aspergillus foveolatus TaxID=210207 RepID=UPI003CCE094A
MPSSLRVGAEVQIQHLNQAKASSGSGSALALSEDGVYIERAGVRRLTVANPDPSSPSSSSSSFGRSRPRSQSRAHKQIQQPVDSQMTDPRRYSRVFKSATASTRVQECSEALARSKPVFHPRNSPHPPDGLASDDIYSLRSILEDELMPASSASSSSARSPSPSPRPASGLQREPKPQAQAPSTAYTNMPLPTKDTAGRRIVIHLSNHEPGPKIIPQKDGVFIRTEYAVEISSVQFGSGSYTDTRPCSNSSASTFVSSLRAAVGASNSSSSFSEISGSRSSTSTLSASTGSNSTATNEIAGLDISKVKPAYFYQVLRAGTVSMQRSASSESDTAQRRRRRKRKIRATESNRS